MNPFLRKAVVLALVSAALPACGGGGGGERDDGTGGATPPPSNRAPGIVLTSPVDGATFTEGSNIDLEAQISDDDGWVTRVDFFEGGTLLGSDSAWPFQWTWAGARPGRYPLKAIATDNAGATTTSAAVSIVVAPAGGPPPPPPPPPPITVKPDGQLNGVIFADSSRGWIVGNEGRIYRSDDAGVSWIRQTSGTDVALLRVQFVNTSTGWIVGALGKILKTTDGGSTWNSLNSGTSEHLRGLSFVSASTGWVAGESAVVKTTDGGTTWVPQDPGFNGGWSAVSFVNASTGWLGGIGAVARTTDGGATWTIQPASLVTAGIERSMGFFDARFVSTSRGVMVGATRGGDILRTTSNGGDSWTTRELTANTNTFSGVAFGDAAHFWAVGTDGKIAASVDGGETWTLQSTATFVGLRGVWAVSASRAWAVGDNGTVLRTTDGGATWLVLNGGN